MIDTIITSPHKFGLKDEKDLIFVPITLASLKIHNPEARIIFPNNNQHSLNLNGIEDFKINEQEIDGLNELRDLYVHYNTNTESFERACIERFFILRHVAKAANVTAFFTVESDCLVLDTFDGFLKTAGLSDHCTALTEESCISTAYITLDFLDVFCSAVVNAYRSPEVRRTMFDWYSRSVESGRKGGICDMTFCASMKTGWLEVPKYPVEEFCRVYRGAHGETRCFDNFFSTAKMPAQSTNLEIEASPIDGFPAKAQHYDSYGLYAKFVDGRKLYLSSVHAQGNNKRLIGKIFANYLQVRIPSYSAINTPSVVSV